jgi:hypothetical protein
MDNAITLVKKARNGSLSVTLNGMQGQSIQSSMLHY